VRRWTDDELKVIGQAALAYNKAVKTGREDLIAAARCILNAVLHAAAH
jgi:hypothetical protein